MVGSQVNFNRHMQASSRSHLLKFCLRLNKRAGCVFTCLGSSKDVLT